MTTDLEQYMVERLAAQDADPNRYESIIRQHQQSLENRGKAVLSGSQRSMPVPQTVDEPRSAFPQSKPTVPVLNAA